MLARSAPLLRLAEQAAARPHCDFNRPWEQGARMLLPEYASVLHLARLLAVRALLRSEAGQPEAALRSVAAGARIGRHMSEDPIAIAALIRVAVHAIMGRPFRDVLRRYADRPDVLRQERQAQQEFGPPLDLRNNLRGEVVLARSMMDEVRTSQPGALRRTIERLPIPSSNPHQRADMADAWEARMLNYWRRAFQQMNAANGDLLETYHALKTLGDEQDKKASQPTYEMSAFLMPVFSGVALKALQSEAERRLSDTAIVLLAHRQHTGAFPDTLAELPAPPPLLADPFTRHAPLRYRQTERGFTLYSIGPNFQDDNGDGQRKKKGEQPPDLVFAFP